MSSKPYYKATDPIHKCVACGGGTLRTAPDVCLGCERKGITAAPLPLEENDGPTPTAGG